jgi:hypothetical protein
VTIRVGAVMTLVGLTLAGACGDDLPARFGDPVSGAGGDSGGGTGGEPTSGGSGGDPGGTGGAPIAGGTGGTGTPGANGCSPVFAPDVLTTYEVQIAAAEWDRLLYDFFHMVENDNLNQDIHPYHPVEQFRHDDVVITDAMIRLKGQSSWRLAVEAGDNPPKMQFVISFNQHADKGRFRGLRKVELDMPRGDQTFLRQRVALSYLRDLGVPAQCANNARLVVNGAYYGLFTNLEHQDKEFLQRLYPGPGEADGDLWDVGRVLETNESTMWQPHPRLDAFWASRDPASLAAIADMDAALVEWAGEAMIADADGYWAGRHNWYVYDHPARGWLWIPHDLDASINWNSPTSDPLYFWGVRGMMDQPWQHYLGVITDATWRDRYVEALRRAYEVHGAAGLSETIERWAAQVRDAAGADPTKPFSFEAHTKAVSSLRNAVVSRHDFVRRWLECRAAPAGQTDGDGDGYPFCMDCNDGNPAVSPAAPEVCGDTADQNCNGLWTDGCM